MTELLLRAPGLAWLHRDRGLSPTQIAAFWLAGLVGFALGPPTGPHGVALAVGAGVLALAIAAAVVFVPWGAAPRWTLVLVPLFFLVVVALWREAAGPNASALAGLTLLPLMWAALVVDRWSLLVIIVGSTTVVLLPALGAPSAVTAVEWRRAVLYLSVATLIGFAVQQLVAAARADAERRARLRAASEAIVRSVGDGLVVVDAEYNVVVANDAAVRLVGRDRQRVVGRPLTDLIGEMRPLPAAQSVRIDGECVPVDCSPDVHSGECLIEQADGTTIPVEFTNAPLVAEDGRGGRVVAFREIGERLRTRRLTRANLVVASALGESTSHAEAVPRIAAGLGEVLDATVVTFWDTAPPDSDGPPLVLREYWEDPAHPHPEFARLTRAVTGDEGLPARVLRSGRPEWIADVPAADVARFPRAAAARAEGLRTSIALPLGTGEPVGLLEVSFAHTECPDDLTRDLLAGIAARIGDAARRERLEAEATRLKDEFFALVSHELRTPLTSISGYLELLGDELGADPVAGRFLEIIGRNTSRLRRLVEDLLFVARVDAGRMSLRLEECDLAEITVAAVDAARPSAAAGQLTLSMEVEGPVPLRGDAGRLGQVLDNLLSNAVKFTPAGRSIDVRLAVEPGEGLGWRAVLEVVDTGMGIGPEDLERLFGRFVRSAEAEAANIPGVGLGLVITRAIVDAHGGTIEVTSAPGEGTTFRVELPVAAAARSIMSAAEGP